MSMVFRACVKVWERMVGSQRMKEAQARGRCSICVWVYPSRMERQLLEARLIIIILSCIISCLISLLFGWFDRGWGIRKGLYPTMG